MSLFDPAEISRPVRLWRGNAVVRLEQLLKASHPANICALRYGCRRCEPVFASGEEFQTQSHARLRSLSAPPEECFLRLNSDFQLEVVVSNVTMT